MITLSSWEAKAIEKLEQEKKKVTGQKESFMAGPVAEVLKDFCKQNEEFAKAVVQGGSFMNCMKAVGKGVGLYLSDIDAYKRAVEYYFPGAKITVQMAIDLVGDAKGGDKPAGGITLDFSALL